MNANRSTQARSFKDQSRNNGQVDQDESEDQYFNLHTDGVGYCNDIRWVVPNGRKKDQFLALRIKALRGHVDEPNYTGYDVKVSGGVAIDIVDQLLEVQRQAEGKAKILMAFRLGDEFAEAYMGDVYENNQKTGEKVPRPVIKARLLLVKSVKVDGTLWYERPREEVVAPDDQSTEPTDRQDDEPRDEEQEVGSQEPAARSRPPEVAVQRDRTMVREYASDRSPTTFVRRERASAH